MAPSDALIGEMVLLLAKIERGQRDLLFTSMAGASLAKGDARISLSMNPALAKAVAPFIDDESARESLYEANRQLEALRNQREASKGATPSGLTVVLFFATREQPTEAVAEQYVGRAVLSAYGTPLPVLHDYKLVNLIDQDPGDGLTVDLAHVYYVRAVKHGGYITDYGVPNDGYEGRTADGIPMAALFFWHGEKARGKKRRFGRG